MQRNQTRLWDLHCSHFIKIWIIETHLHKQVSLKYSRWKVKECWYDLNIIICLKVKIRLQFSSVQFSCSVVSDSLQPHESQHARPPCPSPTPGVQSNSCLSSQWCHPSISSSVVPFSSCPQSLPASGSFPMSQLFAWGGQNIGVSASTTDYMVITRVFLLLLSIQYNFCFQ